MLSMRARNPRLGFLRTTAHANSFRSLLRKQFCNVLRQERSVFGVKWMLWRRPMHLVLPMTIEPQKPRLCINARFLNLWMVDTPFSLETLVGVPRFVYPNSYMSKIDDKPGYDHILLSALFLSSILVLNGRGGGWLELRFPSVGRILHLYTRLLDWAPPIFSGV